MSAISVGLSASDLTLKRVLIVDPERLVNQPPHINMGRAEAHQCGNNSAIHILSISSHGIHSHDNNQ